MTGGISSGEACNSYKEYKRDRKLLQELACNSYRFSIEWSRIEPQRGRFLRKEIQHYIDLIDDLVGHGIEPVVTLHHFTNPEWFEASGGWARDDAVEIFMVFVRKILPHLASRVRYLTPINEPNIYASNKYIAGVWHPYRRRPDLGWKVLNNLARAHRQIYKLVKAEYPQMEVGTCVQTVDIVGKFSVWYPLNLIAAGIGAFIFNHLFYFLVGGDMDFAGLNFYSTYRVGLAGVPPKVCLDPSPIEQGVLTMRSEPHRLLTYLRSVSRYGKPIMITENGKLTEDDNERVDYLQGIFAILKKAVAEGIPLIGYQHFTHLDSFEWGFAFVPKFGLFSHEIHTHKIQPKFSARTYLQLIGEFENWHKTYVQPSAHLVRQP